MITNKKTNIDFNYTIGEQLEFAEPYIKSRKCEIAHVFDLEGYDPNILYVCDSYNKISLEKRIISSLQDYIINNKDDIEKYNIKLAERKKIFEDACETVNLDERIDDLFKLITKELEKYLSNNFGIHWTGTKKEVRYDKHIDNISLTKFVSTILEDVNKFKRLKEFNRIKCKDYENEER
jgi:hypothetical protein